MRFERASWKVRRDLAKLVQEDKLRNKMRPEKENGMLFISSLHKSCATRKY